tara:strand:- start:637 stop:2049 length:1413 start_codon:yes stop_codon:yes gene_type:complete
MYRLIIALLSVVPVLSAFAELDRPNVLLICVDDLRPELNCFGADYIKSPHIDGLAANGRAFHRHYVQAPTCGASRYTLLTGLYGSYGNEALFSRAGMIKKDPDSVDPSMPAYFRQNGYTTVSVGKVSHHPGGRGGPDWDDEAVPEMPLSWDRHLLPAGEWQHPRGSMHGLAHGEIRENAKEMDVFQSEEGGDEIYPDGLIVDEAISQLDDLAADDSKPFFLAVGIIRPHLPFGAPARYMESYEGVKLPQVPHPEKPSWESTWHKSGEFMKYNRWGRNPNADAEFSEDVRRHYAACVTYADELVGRMLARLDEHKLRDNTIIVLWGDHGWHLGEHALWGKHALFEESLRSPLIVSYPGIKKRGEPSYSVVETIDIFPTLVEVAGLGTPDYVDGSSLLPILENPESPGRLAFSYGKGARTVRSETHRLILHGSGYSELYDQNSPGGVSQNFAEAHPKLVAELVKEIEARLPK